MVGQDIIVKMSKVDIAAIINDCDEKRQQYGFEKMNDSERVVSLVSYLYYEVEFGNIDGFYYNSAGDYAVETVWALEQIGAKCAAIALKQINALFPGGVPAKDQSTRQEDLERLSSQPDDPFEELEEEFLSDETSIWERLEKFIIMRLDELPKKDTKGA
jgi:hypothetical protein